MLDIEEIDYVFYATNFCGNLGGIPKFNTNISQETPKRPWIHSSSNHKAFARKIGQPNLQAAVIGIYTLLGSLHYNL